MKPIKTSIRWDVLLQLRAQQDIFKKKLHKLVIEDRLCLCKITLSVVTLAHMKFDPYNLR